MRAEVPACCCAGNAVSHSEAHTLSMAPPSCPHAFAVLMSSVITTQPPFHCCILSFPIFFFWPCMFISSCLLVFQIAFVIDRKHPLIWSEVLTSLFFRRACIHGQSTLLREIHWTHDWFGGKTHPSTFSKCSLLEPFAIFSLWRYLRWCTQSQCRLVAHSLPLRMYARGV